ncbi:MXAN_6652 family MXYO-CTERM-anchored protein [Archangium lipolyticum]|uniref:MXAN_6652 family MXYO-CTERM-anchored protein n=1 Tax=Archangium lipolyticum TaxID=2970465 RepID=UPI00214A2C48|nr:MXAN_6652 family MXYO-CTERM-anchored protein [Archangium lipolyticum]
MKFLSYCAAGVVATSLLSTSAFATPNGVSINGYSGKSGATCTACHAAGAAVPTVEITGPETLTAGQTAQYSLIITGGPAKTGGANIALSNTEATLAPATGSGLKPQSGELVQSTPKAFSDNKVQFDFTVTAPNSAGTLTIFAAGNSSNAANGNAGDGVATTKRDVTVTAGGTAPGGEEEPGGCSSTGGAPALMFVLAAAGVTLLRRRHG